MTAHESLAQLAASLVEEIAAGRAVELAQAGGASVSGGMSESCRPPRLLPRPGLAGVPGRSTRSSAGTWW